VPTFPTRTSPVLSTSATQLSTILQFCSKRTQLQSTSDKRSTFSWNKPKTRAVFFTYINVHVNSFAALQTVSNLNRQVTLNRPCILHCYLKDCPADLRPLVSSYTNRMVTYLQCLWQLYCFNIVGHEKGQSLSCVSQSVSRSVGQSVTMSKVDFKTSDLPSATSASSSHTQFTRRPQHTKPQTDHQCPQMWNGKPYTTLHYTTLNYNVTEYKTPDPQCPQMSNDKPNTTLHYTTLQYTIT
jgi:hypothetical protein